MPIRPTPNSVQAKFDRLNTMAQRRPLGQTDQRNLAFYQKQLGIKPPQDFKTMPIVMPMVSPQPSNTPNPASQIQQTVNGGPAPNYGSMTQMTAPTGGMGGGMPGATGMPNTSMLPAGAAFKRGGKVKQTDSGGMTSKVTTASKRGDGIAQRGKTKGRMV